MKPTGWIHTDAIAFVPCPRCKARSGRRCYSPSGRPCVYPHKARIDLYVDMFGPALVTIRQWTMTNW